MLLPSTLSIALGLWTFLASTFPNASSFIPQPQIKSSPFFSHHYHVHYPRLHKSLLSIQQVNEQQYTNMGSILHSTMYDPENDFLIVDSVHLDKEQRPSFLATVANPRDILALALCGLGFMLSYLSVRGYYGTTFLNVQYYSILLGLINALASCLQVGLGYNVNTDPRSIRRGIVNDATVTLYAGAYTAAVTWQAWRTSMLCPLSLTSYDGLFSWMAVSVYLFSILAPVTTLMGSDVSAWLTNWRQPKQQSTDEMSNFTTRTPGLSDTELLRARGLLGIGFFGCLFAPEAIAFGLGGQEWWGRITNVHTSQMLLESSTALFAIYATESCMVCHRCGKAGVAPYSVLVPTFAIVCILLAILPCVASLYWLGDDISFLSFYRE